MNTRAGRWVAGALLLLGAGALVATLVSAGSLPVAPQRLTAYRSCVLSAFPNTSGVAADAWVREDLPTFNGGASTELHVRSNSGTRRRTYVRFDLSSCSPTLPTSATVRSAELRLFVFAVPTASSTYAVHRVTNSWDPLTIRWGNQPGVAGAATGTARVCSASSCVNRYYDWNVTADVAAFVAGAAPNHGWQLRDVAEGATSTTTRFRPNERNRAAEDPVLVIVYT